MSCLPKHGTDHDPDLGHVGFGAVGLVQNPLQVHVPDVFDFHIADGGQNIRIQLLPVHAQGFCGGVAGIDIDLQPLACPAPDGGRTVELLAVVGQLNDQGVELLLRLFFGFAVNLVPFAVDGACFADVGVLIR